MDPHPRLLLIGKNGQVGHDILPLLESMSDVTAVDRSSLNLAVPDDIQRCVRSLRPEIIVNAAAYTAVDKAEAEPEVARAINATGPQVLAQEARAAGSILIHYSTDYVFDGTKPDRYVETDPMCPLEVYGNTKAEGEEAIRNSGCRHLIFRTSWVFSNRGNNFLLTMLRLARERDQLRIVNDQMGAPTSSESLARATVEVLKSVRRPERAESLFGTYHMAACGETSWFGFASEIFRQASMHLSLRIPKLHAITTSEYPTPAKRPLNSRLNCEKLKLSFGVTMPTWEECLTSVITTLSSAECVRGV
ncbi:MAG: dTDP-4-dehydrorhamnose reductase [Terriglobales bacterium]